MLYLKSFSPIKQDQEISVVIETKLIHKDDDNNFSSDDITEDFIAPIESGENVIQILSKIKDAAEEIEANDEKVKEHLKDVDDDFSFVCLYWCFFINGKIVSGVQNAGSLCRFKLFGWI